MPFPKKDPLDVGKMTGVRVSARTRKSIEDQGFTLAESLRQFIPLWNEAALLRSKLRELVNEEENP